MKVGRPSKYDPKYIDELNEYLEEAIPENMDIPTVEGFALRIGTSRQAIYRWAKEHKEFRNTFRRLKMLQKQHLVKIGIFGGKEINATIVQLLLRVNHKMVETTKSDITSGGKPLPLLSGIKDVRNNDSADEAEEAEEED